MTTSVELLSCLEFAVQAARRAGVVARSHFQTGVAIDVKGDGSPVTLADRGTEQELRGMIRAEYPDDAILGEELGEVPGTSGRRWIVDPIDGTQSFVHGVPLFGVLVALEDQGRPVLGVAYLPMLEELVYAACGHGCWWLPAGHDPKTAPLRARVSSKSQISDGLLLTAGFEFFAQAGRVPILERLGRAARNQRGWGDCYGQIMVATGRAEALVEPIMNPWDAAPFLPILTEAGGAFTDWKGNASITGGNSISSNGHVHKELLRLVRE